MGRIAESSRRSPGVILQPRLVSSGVPWRNRSASTSDTERHLQGALGPKWTAAPPTDGLGFAPQMGEAPTGGQTMNSTTYSEFEDWLPRPSALKLALVLWMAGLALAVGVGARMHSTAHEPASA